MSIRHGRLSLSALEGLLLAGFLLLFLAGCEDEDAGEAAEENRSDIGVVAASEQRAGDPEAGYRALVNDPYVSCGIPYDAYRRVAPETAEVDLLPGRAGRNAELPYPVTSHVNEDGVEIVSNNCLTCHAARFGGELIVGLGNEFGDFTTDPTRIALQAGNYVRGEAEIAAWEHWAERLDGIAPYIRTETVGVNPAPNLTWALMAHRDPETLEWSEDPLLEPPPEDPLPISVPPWWGMQKKNAMFYTTIGRGDQAHFMLLASMMCVEDTDELAEIDAYAADVRAFITSLEAPEYPYSIDHDLAADGEIVFGRECSACHGTYGEQETYPNRVYGIDEVGTDPVYATEATDGSRDRFYQWVARSPYGNAESAAPARGYIAPPLDGFWATAPYLHNGSIPSIEALLSGDRPTYWRHAIEPRRYDPDALGWEYLELDAQQTAEADAEASRYIYDTTIRGYGNMGHTYGNDLSEAEAAALIEYLKTL